MVDNAGYIYVTEYGNNRVSKWDSAGNAIGWIGGGSNGWKTGPAPSAGSDYQSFTRLHGICLDSKGNIYIAGFHNYRVDKWDSAGNALGWIGGGRNGWQFGNAPSFTNGFQSTGIPTSVFVTNNGTIYIADYNNYRISKWKEK